MADGSQIMRFKLDSNETFLIINECCVGVSTGTVLQIVKFYIVVKRILKLTFRTINLHRSECMSYK